MQFQAVLLILLPVFTPLIGSSTAAVLAQDKWPAWANDTIAWSVLLIFAGGDMWANAQFAGGWVEITADAVQAITLLSSGWLVKLSPWLIWLQWLQSNLFNLVPLFEQIEKPMLAPPGLTSVVTNAYTPPTPKPIVMPPPNTPPSA